MLGQGSPHLPVANQPQFAAENSTPSVRKDPHRGKGFRSLPRMFSVLATESCVVKVSRKLHGFVGLTLPFTCGGPSDRRERGPASGETAS